LKTGVWTLKTSVEICA